MRKLYSYLFALLLLLNLPASAQNSVAATSTPRRLRPETKTRSFGRNWNK